MVIVDKLDEFLVKDLMREYGMCNGNSESEIYRWRIDGILENYKKNCRTFRGQTDEAAGLNIARALLQVYDFNGESSEKFEMLFGTTPDRLKAIVKQTREKKLIDGMQWYASLTPREFYEARKNEKQEPRRYALIEKMIDDYTRDEFTGLAYYSRFNNVTSNELWLDVLDKKYDSTDGIQKFREYVAKREGRDLNDSLYKQNAALWNTEGMRNWVEQQKRRNAEAAARKKNSRGFFGISFKKIVNRLRFW